MSSITTPVDKKTRKRSRSSSPTGVLAIPLEPDFEEEEECMPGSEEDTCSTDPDYDPSPDVESYDKDEWEDLHVATPHNVLESKYIVFNSSLDELFKFCQQCGKPVIEKTRFMKGSMVGYTIRCHGNCLYTWRSQPVVHHLPLGNLLLTAAILGTGCTYSKMNSIAKAMNLKMFSRTTFSKIQKKHVFPVIQEAWVAEKKKVVQEMKDHPNLVLSGDGRCDSPGYSAKYGAYTLMHASGDGTKGTNKIVDIQLIQSTEVS